jgi:glutaminyl-peptide cyclotransferase
VSRLRVAAALVALAAGAVSGTTAVRAAGTEPPRALGVEVVRSFPHDRAAFTEGLVLAGGRLYESTGNYGRSELRDVDLRTGRVLRLRRLPATQFGEGLALVGRRLVQLTYREGVAIIWDRTSFRRVGTRSYRGEGWGLCHDGKRLVQSNGSSWLTFRDPTSFRAVRRVQVVVQGAPDARAGLAAGPVAALNELECVGDRVYANVWHTDLIVEIDPATGRVTGVIDASDLLAEDERVGVDVLNGIAFVPERKTFLLTGKYWPRLFEVRFVPR